MINWLWSLLWLSSVMRMCDHMSTIFPSHDGVSHRGEHCDSLPMYGSRFCFM